jgi:hypothetical protein
MRRSYSRLRRSSHVRVELLPVAVALELEQGGADPEPDQETDCANARDEDDGDQRGAEGVRDCVCDRRRAEPAAGVRSLAPRALSSPAGTFSEPRTTILVLDRHTA